jgi:hypothetical protein
MKIFKFLDIDRQLQEMITDKMYDYVCSHTNILSIPQSSYDRNNELCNYTTYKLITKNGTN